MTVSTTGSSAQFYPNGATTHFPFRFRFFQNSDLKVFWQDLTGNIELLRLNSDYTVQGAGAEDGGAIDTTGVPLPNGTLVVSRVMVATQLTSFRNQGEFFAEIHEDAFDRLIMLVQQTIDSQGRGLTIPPTDPLDINLELPSSVIRAGKLLAFDDLGQPAASNLTLAQLEQQPALAMEAAEAAVAAANAAGVSAGNSATSASSANASKNAAAGSATAAAASAKSAADAGFQLGMSSWGFRGQPFKGFALDDGQELERALYPDFAAALDAGLFPLTTEALWQGFAEQRGRFVANSSPGKFRMRDLNGVQSGGFGPVFLRGSPVANGGYTRLDQMQGHTHNYTSYVATGGGLQSSAATATNPVVNTISGPVSDGVNGTPRTGTETFPTHVVGAWMTRLYGVITPLGSAEASSLATAYASIASRTEALETWRTQRSQVYDSGFRTYTANTWTNLPHGLPFQPDCFALTLRARVLTSGNWPVGSLMQITQGLDHVGNNVGHGVAVMQAFDTTNLRVWVGLSLHPATVDVNATVLQAAIPSQWDMRIRAWSAA